MTLHMLFAAWLLGCPGTGPDGNARTDEPCVSDRDCADGLACSADGACAPIPPGCGDGVLGDGEVCDGAELNGATCADLVGLSGDLACLGDCSGYNTSGCTCTPTTCAALAAECGPVDDGCGVEIDCGTCDGWLECGFAQPNVCGAGCPEGCPSSASCSDEGVCVGVDLGDIDINVVTLTVEGVVTLNGTAPTDGPGCAGPTDENGTVTFVEPTYGYTFAAPLYCGGAGAFGPIAVYPGTYEVSVDGSFDESDLPLVSFVVETTLALATDTVDLAFDVPTIDVSGSVTLNGVAPADGPGCAGATDENGTVTFTETTHGYSFAAPLYCGGGGAFGPLPVFPGTYDVRVSGSVDETNLPAAAYVARAGLALLQDTSGLALDVATVSVEGTVTLNGAAPQDGLGCAGPTDQNGTVTLLETTYGYTVYAPLYCGGGGAFGPVDVFPGTYRLSVFGTLDETDLPTVSYIAEGDFVLLADTSGVVLDVATVDVSGVVTLNGAPPADGIGCSGPTDQNGTVTFIHTTWYYAFAVPLYCGGGGRFGPAVVFPGEYYVYVNGSSDESNLPITSYAAAADLALYTDTTTLTLDVPTVTASGTVTLNGVPPTDGVGCAGPTDANGTVTFTETTFGYSFGVPLYCGGAGAFGPADLFPGTYDVRVQGSADESNLPLSDYVAAESLTITTNTTGLAFDVKTRAVAGVVTLNGEVPQDGPGCSGPLDQNATVTLVEISHGYSLAAPIYCGGGGAFGPIEVFPGIYTIRAYGSVDESDLPTAAYVAYSRLEVP